VNSSRHIIITGFMGSGKTTIAQGLAHVLGRQMLDLDHLIAKKEGRTAQEIIDQDGEESFRDIETQTLQEALATSLPGVIALGGGAWTIERTRNLIHRHAAITVWLDAPFDLCWDRILRSGGGRPLARDERPARKLYADRRPLYALAELHVAVTANKSTDRISAEIAQALGLSANP
jgi:shikimate kinase